MNVQSHQLKNGNVLIKLRMTNDRIQLKNGKVIWLDEVAAREDYEHTNIVGEVIQIPQKAYYVNHMDERYEVPIEILPGDIVYCHYLTISSALRQRRRDKVVYNPQGRVITEDNEVYLLIPYYNNFFVAIRNGEPVMLNDYILVEPTYMELELLRKESESQGLTVPHSKEVEMKKNTQYGIVRYVGKNIIHEEEKAYFSDEELHPGVEIMFTKNADIPLEYDIHKTFEPEKTFFRVKRRDVLMILE